MNADIIIDYYRSSAIDLRKYLLENSGFLVAFAVAMLRISLKLFFKQLYRIQFFFALRTSNICTNYFVDVKLYKCNTFLFISCIPYTSMYVNKHIYHWAIDLNNSEYFLDMLSNSS